MSTNTEVQSREAVIEAITGLVRELLRTGPDITVDESTRLVDDLGMDSSAVFGLLLELEDALGVELDTDKLKLGDLASAGALADFVARCRP